LQYEQYRPLRANPDETSQYDPFHPQVVPLLHKWIEEYLDLFGEVRYFHIGADEARQLDFVQQSDHNTQGLTVSQVFMRHINAVSKPLTDRGVTPIIWADMVLHHHAALDELSRDVMIFDWMYDIWRERKRVFIWGDDRGLRSRDQLTPENLKLFGKYLFPNGDAPGVQPETFYSADFLADKGFQVVTCPGSSSYGDNVFSLGHPDARGRGADELERTPAPVGVAARPYRRRRLPGRAPRRFVGRLPGVVRPARVRPERRAVLGGRRPALQGLPVHIHAFAGLQQVLPARAGKPGQGRARQGRSRR
jgi:hypothetical protein